MIPTALVLAILGIAALSFGSWGRFTEAGRRKYDEMAGMIPYFSYYAGIVLLLVSIVLWLFIARGAGPREAL